MKNWPLLLCLIFACAGCASGLKIVRTPPGTSVEVALAKRAELVRSPWVATAGQNPLSPIAERRVSVQSESSLPSVEPSLPVKDDDDLQVADAFTRGQLCLKTGADDEAIAAFQEVVRADPQFSEAWYLLAALYERKGEQEKSMEAFRNSKKFANR